MHNFKNISLLYFTCLTYKSLWESFFKLKNKYMDNTTIKTYLCTDILNDDHNIYQENNINILTFNKKSNFTINGNLYDRILFYLNNIDSKYILFFIDDMYIMDYVNFNKLQQLINIMENNEDIKIIKLSLDSFPFNNGKNVNYDNINFVQADNSKDEYIFNVQPMIMRKEFFIDMVTYCKNNSTVTHQNGGLEIFGTKYFRINLNFKCLRVCKDIIKIPYSGGIVSSGIISENMKKFLKEKENIEIKTYDNNLIFDLTKEEYECVGDRVKDVYKNINKKYSDNN